MGIWDADEQLGGSLRRKPSRSAVLVPGAGLNAEQRTSKATNATTSAGEPSARTPWIIPNRAIGSEMPSC
jgi:hypothetical protein